MKLCTKDRQVGVLFSLFLLSIQAFAGPGSSKYKNQDALPDEIEMKVLPTNQDKLEGKKQRLLAAAESGDVEARYQLGLLYYGEEGGRSPSALQRDLRAAVAEWKKAAQQKHPGALNALGCMAQRGLGGFSQSDEEAVRYFTRGSRLRNGFAKRNLACLMLDGRGGLARDLDQIYSLMKQAGELGCESAVRDLNEFRKMRDEARAKRKTEKKRQEALAALQSLRQSLVRTVKQNLDLDEPDAYRKQISAIDHVQRMVSEANPGFHGNGNKKTKKYPTQISQLADIPEDAVAEVTESLAPTSEASQSTPAEVQESLGVEDAAPAPAPQDERKENWTSCGTPLEDSKQV